MCLFLFCRERAREGDIKSVGTQLSDICFLKSFFWTLFPNIMESIIRPRDGDAINRRSVFGHSSGTHPKAADFQHESCANVD